MFENKCKIVFEKLLFKWKASLIKTTLQKRTDDQLERPVACLQVCSSSSCPFGCVLSIETLQSQNVGQNDLLTLNLLTWKIW